MSFTLWLCKRITRRAIRLEAREENHLSLAKRYKEWRAREIKRLDKLLNKLSEEEHLDYAYDMGYIEEADYLIMMQIQKNKKVKK